MSIERSLNIIDNVLQILDEADKRESCTDSVTTCEKTSCAQTESAPTCNKSSSAQSKNPGPSKPFVYFQSLDEIQESQLVQVTPDIAVLRPKWKEAGLVDNDELEALCNQIGKVVEIESSDDTLQIQWENYDTCWTPAFACGLAPSGSKPTIPGTNNSWLNESKAVGAEFEEEQKRDEEEANVNEEDGSLIPNVEDHAVIKGNTLRVTKELPVLKTTWATCELPPYEQLCEYLGVVGTIQEIREDDDTVLLRWANDNTAWIPVQACIDAKGAEPTLPQT